MSEWKEYVLENVVEKFIDYRGKTPSKTSFGIPLITAKVVKDGRITEPNEFIAAEDYDSWMTRGFPEINDIVLTTEAPLGEVALIKNKNVALAQRIITLHTNKKICNTIFLKYYFQSNIGQSIIQARASGSTVEGIKSAELRKIVISLPKLSEQAVIAEVLSSLDDKIDLLHRQNKTLEQLAETLFRQWFVEEAEEGWEEKELGQLLDFIVDNRGKTAPTCNYGIPLIATNCVKNDNIFPVYEKVRYVSMETYNNWFRAHLEPGDVLFVNKGTPGCVNLVPNPVDFCIAQDMIALRPNKQIASNYYIFLLLRSDSFQADIQNRSVGTTIPHLKKTDLIRMKIMIPNSSLLNKFNEIVEPKFTKMNNNNQQIRTLIQLRDTLLPKLMSGEVRVTKK
jgi:type I restriction enzyme S subunit